MFLKHSKKKDCSAQILSVSLIIYNFVRIYEPFGFYEDWIEVVAHENLGWLNTRSQISFVVQPLPSTFSLQVGESSGSPLSRQTQGGKYIGSPLSRQTQGGKYIGSPLSRQTQGGKYIGSPLSRQTQGGKYIQFPEQPSTGKKIHFIPFSSQTQRGKSIGYPMEVKYRAEM